MQRVDQRRRGGGAWLLILLILAAVPLLGRPAAGGDDPKKGKEVFDDFATAGSAVNPIIGGVFKGTGEFLNITGYFGNAPDPVGDSIKRINQRLDQQDARIAALETAVQKLQNEVYSNANLARLRHLRDLQRSLRAVLVRLDARPPDKATRVALAHDAQDIAEEFLVDTDLWMWSDMALKNTSWGGQSFKAGQLMTPDFKPWPALEYYTLALVTWMTGMEYAGGGDTAWVRQTYGDAIQKHLDYLNLHPGWNKITGTPQSLPEMVKKRVSGYYLPDKYPINKVCHFSELTQDSIAREVRFVQEFSYPAKDDNELCTVPDGLLNRSTEGEDDLEAGYGVGVMWTLADRLARLKNTGTAREQLVGTFPIGPTVIPAFLYGVRPDGRLTWYRHDSARVNVPGKPEDLKVSSPFSNGWDVFRSVIPGGRNVIYAITRDGRLLWYRHNGFNTGAAKEWEGGTEIAGGGWADYKLVFSGGGQGVLYGITRAGKIVWYRHSGHATGARTWEGGKEVGSDWGNYTQVFSGGGGIVYAVAADGRLFWYKHLGYADGTKAWEGPKEIAGGGWGDYRKLFAAGDGLIYGITQSGKLIRYRHLGFANGTRSWEPGREVASGWGAFTQTLALLPDSTSDIPR